MSRSRPSWLATELGSCYSLHLVPRYKHARHYQGWSKDLPQRLVDHLMGRGANFPSVVLKAGGKWVVTDLEHGVTRDRETQRKETSAVKRCPICKAEKAFTAGELTAAEALAKAGWDAANPAERDLLLEDFGLEEAPAELAGPEPEPEQIEIWHERTPASEITPEQRAELYVLADALIDQWTASPKEAECEMEPG